MNMNVYKYMFGKMWVFELRYCNLVICLDDIDIYMY